VINNGAAGIYVHVPFCVRKCSYCDFYSLPIQNQDNLEKYTENLLLEIEQQAGDWENKQFSTVYIGGGTPSLLSPKQINRILVCLFCNLAILPQTEISLEANPATLDLKSLQELKNAGINRISLGVQSFRDEELKILGRIHNAEAARKAADEIIKAGFDNFNLDLIYGIPGQSMKDWIYNLQMAVSCQPRHISTYLLQLDSSVPLAKQINAGRYNALSEDQEAEMYYGALEYLTGEGYHHYEISNFARQGYECNHNLVYWQAGEYLGLGPGAVSHRDGRRWLNKEIKSCPDFENRKRTVETLEIMNDHDRFVDAVILGLRMTEGISRQQFIDRFGIDFYQEYHSIIEKFKQEGLLIAEQDRIYFSQRGYFLSNQLLAELL
jgi:oxygen-independent coproporphyrinogen-3 oxidase